MDQIIKIPTKDEYYNQPDSVYLRIQYHEPLGFRITSRNEVLLNSDGDTKAGEFLQILARGLIEIAYGAGEDVYRTGKQSLFHDMVVASGDELSEELKDIWFGPTTEGIH